MFWTDDKWTIPINFRFMIPSAFISALFSKVPNCTVYTK